MTRFLIVRLGALGDIVHAIPVAAALRRAFPDARIDWLVSGKHREILDLVPAIDRSLPVKDRGGRGGGESLSSTIRGLRETKYDVALDLQGLIKSAVIARLSGAARVVGFNGRYARESLARLFYTDVHDPGGEGIYAPSETRHVVEINLGLLAPLGITDTATEFPIDARESAIARTMTDADRWPLRAAQSRCGLAQQTLAAGAAGRAGRRAARAARLAVGDHLGPWRARARRGGGDAGRRGGDPVAADGDCRCRGTGARRSRHGVGRHRSDAPRGGGRDTDRWHLRPHATRAERALGARGRDRLAGRDLSVSSLPLVQGGEDVPPRHRGGRGARGGGAAAELRRSAAVRKRIASE